MAWYECHVSRLSGADHWLISAQVLGDQAQALLAECNRTDNLSGFVRGIRKLFRSAVAEEEVAAAAAALREKANIVPPSYVPVEEPVSEPEPVAPRTPFNTKPDDMVPL